eukprot:gene11782-15765_t
MKAIIEKIVNSSNAENLQNNIVLVDHNLIMQLRSGDGEKERVELSKYFIDCSENSNMIINAKIRRKIKRLVQFLDLNENYSIPSENNEEMVSAVNNNYSNDSQHCLENIENSLSKPYKKPEELIQFSSSKDLIHSFTSSTSASQVETILNSINIDLLNEMNDRLNIIQTLKSISEKSFLYKMIRRRLNRLVYALSNENERKELMIAHANAVKTAENKPKQNKKSEYNNSNNNNIKSISNNNIINHKNDFQNGIKIDLKTDDNNKPEEHFFMKISNDNKSFSQCLNELNFDSNILLNEDYINNLEVNVISVAIDGIGPTEEEPFNHINCQNIINILELILNNNNLTINAKLKRKLKRLISSLNEGVLEYNNINNMIFIDKNRNDVIDNKYNNCIETVNVSNINEISNVHNNNIHNYANKNDNYNNNNNNNNNNTKRVVPIITSTVNEINSETISNNNILLEPIIEKVSKVTSVNELIDSIADVRQSCGNTTTRRKLKRSIEQVLKTAPFISSSEINNDSNNDDHNNSTNEYNSKAKPSELSSVFQSNGITGEIHIRILTDSNTFQSKGMAFVDFENPADLYKAISLHKKMMINNRLLNIEKSCGGKNKDNRLLKINDSREEQLSKIKIENEQLLEKYHVFKNNKISDIFKDKLLRTSPVILEKVIQEWFSKENNNRSYAKLDEMLSSSLSLNNNGLVAMITDDDDDSNNN